MTTAESNTETIESFDVGEIAVFPGAGVGKIEKIENQEHNGMPYQVYVLKFFSSDNEIDVPVISAVENGLRPVMPPEKIDELLEVLSDRDFEINKQTWNRRYREYTQKLATGDVIEICMVFRDLALIKVRKSLSFGERKMYEQAHGLLVEEMAHVRLKQYVEGVHSGTTEIVSNRRIRKENEEALQKHFDAHLEVLRQEAIEQISERFRQDEEEEAKRRAAEEELKKKNRKKRKGAAAAEETEAKPEASEETTEE